MLGGTGCKETLKPASGGVGFQKHRLRLASGSLLSVTVQGDGPPHTNLPDNRMGTFLAFISAATDFVLTLNLKPAIVAAALSSY